MNNRCTCGTSCAFLSTAISIIAGIVIGLLFYFGAIPFIATPLIVTLVVGAAAFIIRKKRKAKKLTEDEDEDI